MQVLSTLSTLETLDLEDNLLGAAQQPEGAFPAGIAGLSRLQWLNIARCELQQVPHLVERLSALRILDLTNNRSGFPPLEILYSVLSIQYNLRIRIRTCVDEITPVSSVTSLVSSDSSVSSRLGLQLLCVQWAWPAAAPSSCGWLSGNIM